MTVNVDHLLWASPDLGLGTAAIAALTGVAPVQGGSHPGFGTRNSLISLGDSYLEVIAPDPAQSLAGNRGGVIAAMPGPGLMTFAVRTGDLAATRAAAEAAGLTVEGPVAMSRTRLDGVRLDWACLYATHPLYGDLIPFAIDWRGSPHPSGTTPEGCRLVELTALHPDPAPLAEIYRALAITVPVKRAMRPGFMALLETPDGPAILSSL